MIKLLKYSRPFIKYMLLVILFMCGQAVAELYLPTLMSDVVNKGMVTGNTGVLLGYGGTMLLMTVLSVVCAVCGSFFSAIASTGIGKDLRSAVFSKAESFSLSEYDKFGAASLITRTTNDIVQVQTSLLMILRFMVYAPIMCAGGLFMAVTKDKGLTMILAVSIPVIIVFVAVLGKIALPLFREMQKKIDKLNLVAREGLTGVRVIRAYNRQYYEEERFDAANTDLMQNAIKVNRMMALMMPVIMLVMNLTSISVIWFGGLRIDAGLTDLGGMMAFSQYAIMILFSFVMVSVLFIMIPRAAASAERINEVLETESEIKDPETPQVPETEKGVIEFKNVTFRYKGAERAALSDITFKAEPGKTTAIIGGTGSGKTTLVNLIPRFYDVSDGQVLLDGLDVRNMTQEYLRSKIGYVPQKASLFSETVSENIRYGNENATDLEVKRSAEIAQADAFIQKKEDGYGHLVSQGGSNVSGGQRQRLSIARAVVRRPLIYVFDDSFSALDMKTDADLRAALKNETNDSTVIIVAQRISSIMDADTIIALEDGEVKGVGTHEELLRSCELYREIAQSQGKG